MKLACGTGLRGLLHSNLTSVIIGAFYDVYNELGPGFLEIGEFRCDLLVDDKVIVEITRRAR